MIRHERLAEPVPVFVRSFNHSSCLGHGVVTARRLFAHPERCGPPRVIYLDVRLVDGTCRTVTPDMVFDPTNVSARTIAPAPLRIPAPPRERVFP